MNNLIFSALTQEEQMAIAGKWISPAGLVLNEKNGAIIRDYIIAKAAQWNEHSFTQAALILRDKLEWEKKSDQRSAKARLTELGIRPSAHASQADKDADLDAKIKLARDFIENGPQGQRRRYKEQQARWDSEHVTLYFKNGRVDHAGSETARNEAIAAHQAADIAAKSGLRSQVMVPNKLLHSV